MATQQHKLLAYVSGKDVKDGYLIKAYLDAFYER